MGMEEADGVQVQRAYDVSEGPPDGEGEGDDQACQRCQVRSHEGQNVGLGLPSADDDEGKEAGHGQHHLGAHEDEESSAQGCPSGHCPAAAAPGQVSQ